jgi:hypothetical protein
LGRMEGSCTERLRRPTETPLWHRLELELLAVLHGSGRPTGADATVEECGGVRMTMAEDEVYRTVGC